MNLYHITDKKNWAKTLETGVYKPNSFSTDGFIHCSTAAQVIPVANRFFAGHADLILLTIDMDLLSPPVVYENLEGGVEQFPHIYGPLNIEAVTRVTSFIFENTGALSLPDGTFDGL